MVNKITNPPSQKELIDKVNEIIDDKQDTLVSGTNIKTINNTSILGSGNIEVGGGYTAGTGIDITNNVISVEGVKDQRNTSTAIKTWTGTKAQYDALGNVYYNWITTETLYKWSGSGAVKDVYVKHSGALVYKETLYDETGTELTGTYEVGGDSTATTVSIYFPTQYYTYTYSGTIQSVQNSVYTKSVRNPTTSTTIYNSSLEESSLTITSVSTDSMVLSDGNTYNYNQSGNMGGNGYDSNTEYLCVDTGEMYLGTVKIGGDDNSIWSTHITNCITEISQDIKLELNNGTVTLKAGSKVYVPNGVGVYNTITISSDISLSQGWGISEVMLLSVFDGSVLQIMTKSRCVSGSTDPLSSQDHWWYNTTNNTIRFINSDGTVRQNAVSLPIAIITMAGDGSKVNSIDQVFNGFGYIGSTVFALPGVKGLIPNGRNVDGTLKNLKFSVNNVLIYTYTNSLYAVKTNIISNSSGIATGLNYREITGTQTSGWYFNNQENIYTYNGNLMLWCDYGEISTSSGKITSFTPKTAFHAADYNDVVLKQDLATDLNGKADTDLSNINASGKSFASGLGMPSDRYIDLTLGASGSTYTAPANGYFCFSGKDSGNTGTAEIVLRNQTRYFGVAGTNTNSAKTPAWTGYILPAKKGDKVYIYYLGTLAFDNTNWSWRFYYAGGEA